MNLIIICPQGGQQCDPCNDVIPYPKGFSNDYMINIGLIYYITGKEKGHQFCTGDKNGGGSYFIHDFQERHK